MSCKDIEHNLPAYLEDDLSSQDKTLVEKHLASCPQCSKAIEHLKKAGKLVREMEEVEPPPWLTQKIMSRVREEAKPKESVFRKLFYPLHIKIPIQALATVLIAVFAFHVYRVGEPDVKVIVAPPAAVFESGKEQPPSAPQKSPDFAPAPSAKAKAVPIEGAKKDRDMLAASLPGGSKETIGKENMRTREEMESSENTFMIRAEKKESPQDKDAEAMQTAASVKQQEAPKALPAPAREYKRSESRDYAGAAKAKREYEAAPAEPQIMGAAVRKMEQINVTVHVTDASASVRDVETLLGKFSARQIQRKSRDDKEILTAVINTRNLRELLRKLKTIGETEEKGIPDDIQERDISITIELY
jgi:hypothetical protein